MRCIRELRRSRRYFVFVSPVRISPYPDNAGRAGSDQWRSAGAVAPRARPAPAGRRGYEEIRKEENCKLPPPLLDRPVCHVLCRLPWLMPRLCASERCPAARALARQLEALRTNAHTRHRRDVFGRRLPVWRLPAVDDASTRTLEGQGLGRN
jgi:hypothetical protein